MTYHSSTLKNLHDTTLSLLTAHPTCNIDDVTEHKAKGC